MMVPMMLNKTAANRLGDLSWYTRGDKITAWLSMILSYGTLILSIGITFKTGTPWFYAGMVILLVGIICYLVAKQNYATTPENEAVNKGMYRISRHPLYLFYGIMPLGIIVATLSVPLFIVWALCIFFIHFMILREERFCLKTYPDSYPDYMQKVPRNFLIF
jgi:protein-S-isoprenylcysteine O-methyltransferase Ste14